MSSFSVERPFTIQYRKECADVALYLNIMAHFENILRVIINNIASKNSKTDEFPRPFFIFLFCLIVDFAELLYNSGKIVDRTAYDLGFCHIDSGNEQAIERRLGTAALKEVDILINVFLALGFDSLNDGRGGGDTGCVLINIEAGVEMRYSHPLISNLLVAANVTTEIELDKIIIMLIDAVSGKRYSLFTHGVHITLEFGKHGLAVESALVCFHELIQDIQLLFIALALLEHSVSHKKLINGGGYLGNEDSVSGVMGLVVVVGEPGVHRVSCLVSKRGYVIKLIGEIKQNVGLSSGNA